MCTPPKRLGPKWYQDLSHLLQFSRACLAKLQAKSFFNHKTTLVYNSRGSAIRTILACISKTNMRQKRLTSMVKTTNLKQRWVQGTAPTRFRLMSSMKEFNASHRATIPFLRTLEALYPPESWCNDLKRILISPILKMTSEAIFILQSNKIWWAKNKAHKELRNNRTRQRQLYSQHAKYNRWKGKSST
jgi:hypothetical protein